MLILKRTSLYRRCLVRAFSTDPSVNPDEIKKFSAVGSSWWDSDSKSGTGPLHSMNPIRVNFIRKCLAVENCTSHLYATDQIAGMKILDVGCGGGLLAESLSRLGAQVTAIDPSRENINVASQHSKLDPATQNIEYIQSTIEAMSSTGRKFNAVTCLEVLEHVEKPKQFLAACIECLDDKGSLFLSTINRTAKSYAITIVGAEYLLKLLPTGNLYLYQGFVKTLF